MKRLLLSLGFLASPLAHATTVFTGGVPSTSIPDNNAVGVSDTRSLTVSGESEIASVQVNLTISGGWNGDLYAYLSHNGSTSILLNRVGRTGSNPDGAGSSGMTVSLADAFVADIHTSLPGSGTNPTGSFQPDGRLSDPLFVLDSDPRNALLAVFTGGDANGDWTLFLADQSAGDTSTIESWQVIITLVPEPSTACLMLLGLGAALRRRR